MIYSVDVSAHTDAKITLPALAKKRYMLQKIFWSYSNNPAIGAADLKITSGSHVMIDIYLSGHSGLIESEIVSNPNEVMTITLKGVMTLTAKLSIGYTCIDDV